ncbi:MAG: hypothetical protein ACOC6M_00735 [Halobacteriota archaeon]
MYFEIWVDKFRSKEVENVLRQVCAEVHEVSYDYQYIVDASDESVLNFDGIKKYKKHYDC